MLLWGAGAGHARRGRGLSTPRRLPLDAAIIPGLLLLIARDLAPYRSFIDEVAAGLREVFVGRDDSQERDRPIGHATADDAAYAIFELEDGTPVQFNSSWCTRVRRDDLLTIQVDGTNGSAVADLRHCRIQSASTTPRPIWKPDVEQPLDFYAGWQDVPEYEASRNAFRQAATFSPGRFAPDRAPARAR